MPYCIAGFGGVQAAALASSFRPAGRERAPKSATQHAPTVGRNLPRRQKLISQVYLLKYIWVKYFKDIHGYY